MAIRRIVHPTDFSPASGKAFKKAIELAKDNKAALTIVHVLPTLPLVADAYMAASAYDQMLTAQRRQAEKSMERTVQQARKAGVRVTGRVVDTGAMADTIVRYAKRERADLIVMGTHGHGALAKIVLGSVAERVISRASCPVITVRGK